MLELLKLACRRWCRRIAIALGLRRITPRDGERRPDRLVVVPALDTGGAYRPKHRPQDPAKDPAEPYGGESSSRGSDHGWSGCTMSSAADALAYATVGARTPWGGDMRHRQGDLEGGTDLYDARDAFRAYGEELYIKSGAGWGAVVDAHEQRRAIVIQGTGEVPGSGSFDGGHACAIGIETRSSDGAWLFGDPLCSDWQWIAPGPIRSWAERWQSSIAFAVTVPVSEPEPEPEPPAPAPAFPPAPGYAPGYTAGTRDGRNARDDELLELWLDWLRAPAPGPADRWDAGVWADLELDVEIELLEGTDPDPCEPDAPGRWARGRIPAPASSAIDADDLPATWDGLPWAGALWAGSSVAGQRWRALRPS